nr:uncharacterized protein LOC129447538 [Misgurnus anguillicaudatus]
MLRDDVSYGQWLLAVCSETSVRNHGIERSVSTRKHKEEGERTEQSREDRLKDRGIARPLLLGHMPQYLERCKKWLRAINHQKFGEDTDMGNLKTRRICSRHFKEEDYEPNVLGMKRTTLKDTAIPSIFTFPDDEQPGPSGIKRIRLEPPIASAGLVSSDDEGKLLLTSTPVKIPTSVHEQFSPCPSTPGALNTTISSIEAIGDDESYQPESTITFTSTSSSSSDEGERDWREKKLIVNESSLMSLFKFCQMCGKPISSKTIVDVGAQRKVEWICLGGHAGTWKSSRDVRGMPEVNLLAAAAVLFRGGTYTELVRLVQDHGCSNDWTFNIL